MTFSFFRTGFPRPSTTMCGILLLAALSGCSKEEAPLTTQSSFHILNEDCIVAVPQSAAAQLHTIAVSTESTMTDVERGLSIYEPSSNIAKINQVAGRTRIPISFEAYRLLNHALDYAELTDGAFDITVAPLGALWGLRGGHVPEQPVPQSVLKATLQAVGSDMVELDEKSIRFLSPFTQIDPSSIITGFAVDLAILKHRQRGVRSVYIRLGNSCRVLGVKEMGRRWPFDVYLDREGLVPLGTVNIPASSAISLRRKDENFIVINGVTYSEIIDPRTGYPVTETALTIALGPVATTADALATALIVGGLDEAQKILRQFPKYEAMIIPAQEKLSIWATRGLSEAFQPSKDFAETVQILERADAIQR